MNDPERHVDLLARPTVQWRNLLEPSAFAALFSSFPPVGFQVYESSSGMSLFKTRFDLLTTLERPVRQKLARIPLFASWSKLLRFSACFTGTTITEYTALPAKVTATDLLEELREGSRNQSLAIMKDIPASSPLLSREDNAFAENLCLEAEKKGFLQVSGQALAYLPIDFPSVEEWLAGLSRARRKDLRRKLRVREKLDIEILPLSDPVFQDHGLLAKLYSMYRQVYDQSDIHFDLLTPEFFAALLGQPGFKGWVPMYRHEGRLIGYNICLEHDGMLIDKYIGLSYPEARSLNVYFLSWLVNLQLCLDRGLHTYVAGWTDPEVKAGLGASFTFTRHLVWVKNPLLRKALTPLRGFFEADAQSLKGRAQADSTQAQG